MMLSDGITGDGDRALPRSQYLARDRPVKRYREGNLRQLSLGRHDDPTADEHVNLSILPRSPQQKQRPPACLMALFNTDIYALFTEVLMFDQVPGEAAVGTSRGRVLRHSVVVGKHTNA